MEVIMGSRLVHPVLCVFLNEDKKKIHLVKSMKESLRHYYLCCHYSLIRPSCLSYRAKVEPYDYSKTPKRSCK